MLAPLVITKFDDSTWYPQVRVAGGAGSGNYGHAGRPGTVGGSSPMVLFHGTSSAALASIKKDGLKPGGGKGGDAWFTVSRGHSFNDAHPEFKAQPGLIGDRKASVYLADTADHALMFSSIAQKMHPGSQPVVLEVDIPQSAVEKIHYDEGFRDPESGAFRFKGVIRPEWVRGRVDFNAAGDDSPYTPYAVKALNEIAQRIYVVFLVDNTPKTAGGAGSGNFGHAGRPGHIGGSTVIPSGILSAIQQADGGFTYNALTKDTPTTGYALSLYKEREKIIDAKDANVVALAKYTHANRDLLSKTGNYLGGWHNPTDGKVYLDVSTIVKSAAEAERLGREHKQIAYFDLVKGHSVDISEGAHVAKAATESDGAKRWAAFFARSHRARAPADGERTDSSGDRSSPPDCAAERPLAPTINLKTPTARKAIGVNGRSTAQELTQLQSERQIDALGGAGSGNYGHAGRPGEVGGSTADLTKTDVGQGVSGGTNKDTFSYEASQAENGIKHALGNTNADVYIDNYPTTIRAAKVTEDVLTEMRVKGYTMPGYVEVTTVQPRIDERNPGISGQTEARTVPGEKVGSGNKIETRLRIFIPENLPKDANLDDAVKLVFGGPTLDDPNIDRFAVRTMREVIIHEMGHVQDAALINNRNIPLIFSSNDRENATRSQNAARSVSNYASRNPNEFIAEAFVRKYRGEMLGLDAQKMYDALHGPVIK